MACSNHCFLKLLGDFVDPAHFDGALDRDKVNHESGFFLGCDLFDENWEFIFAVDVILVNLGVEDLLNIGYSLVIKATFNQRVSLRVVLEGVHIVLELVNVLQ